MRYAGISGAIAAGFERVSGLLTRHNVAISGLTKADAVRILGMPEETVTVIPCGVESVPVSLLTERRSPQILYVGRLVRHKRVDLLIGAFAVLIRRFPGARLKIIGTGYHEGELKGQVRRLGLGGVVEFAGQVEQGVLEGAYRESAVFVLPSEQEGFGMVVLEAMAQGLPVMAARGSRSAVQEIVQSGENGLLFEDVRGLEEGLGRLLEDDALRWQLALQGLRTAERYSWTTLAGECEAYYRAVRAAAGGGQ